MISKKIDFSFYLFIYHFLGQCKFHAAKGIPEGKKKKEKFYLPYILNITIQSHVLLRNLEKVL